jgi:hypothetical protein
LIELEVNDVYQLGQARGSYRRFSIGEVSTNKENWIQPAGQICDRSSKNSRANLDGPKQKQGSKESSANLQTPGQISTAETSARIQTVEQISDSGYRQSKQTQIPVEQISDSGYTQWMQQILGDRYGQWTQTAEQSSTAETSTRMQTGERISTVDLGGQKKLGSKPPPDLDRKMRSSGSIGSKNRKTESSSKERCDAKLQTQEMASEQ